MQDTMLAKDSQFKHVLIDFEQIVANICLLGNLNSSLYASLCFIQVIHL